MLGHFSNFAAPTTHVSVRMKCDVGDDVTNNTNSAPSSVVLTSKFCTGSALGIIVFLIQYDLLFAFGFKHFHTIIGIYKAAPLAVVPLKDTVVGLIPE